MSDSIWNAEPETAVTLKGAEAESTSGGLTTNTGGGFMLKIKPRNGHQKMIPYSRIEEIDINQNETHMTLYAGLCLVNIKGRGFDLLITSLQRATAQSVTVGKAEKNDVVIDDITIINSSDSAIE